MKINLLRGFFTKILPCIAMLSACGNPNKEQLAEMSATAMDSTSVAVVSQINTAKEVQENLQEIDSEIVEQFSKKKFVYVASTKAKVKNVAKATAQLWRLGHTFHGFVTGSEVTTDLINTRFMPFNADSLIKLNSYTVQNQVVLRVPAQYLDTVLLEISKMSLFLEKHQIRAEDVTLNLLDNQLKAKLFVKASQRIAQAIEEKGKNVEEITIAEQQSNDKQMQAINLKINKLDLLDKVAFAKIEINFYQEPLVVTEMVENPETDRYEASFESQITDSLQIGWKLLSIIIVNIVKIWFLLPFAAVGYWGYRKYIKNH